MQFSTSTLLFFVTIASIPIRTEATLSFLFNTLFSPLVDRACNLAQASLGLQETATCECDLNYQGIFQGFAGAVVCTTTERRCLVQPDLFCADGTIDFDLKAGLFVPTGLNSNVTACFDVESGFPEGIVELDNSVCFEFAAAGLALAFDACTVTIGSGTCQSCEICESGTDFKFNCTNIDLETANDNIKIDGPAIATCVGLSAVPTPV